MSVEWAVDDRSSSPSPATRVLVVADGNRQCNGKPSLHYLAQETLTQMSKIDKTNNSVKESLPLETALLGQKSDVSSQVTTDRQSATKCLKKVNKNILQRKELLH